MILRPLAAATLLLAASAALADGHFDRTLQVSAQPDLYVSTGTGNIRVNPGSDSQIHIAAHLHADWSADPDVEDRIRRIVANPPIQQSGNSIRVGFPATGRALYNHIAIDYEITAPRAVALNLHSSSGDLEINNLGRFLKADTASGAVRAHGLSGPADLHSSSGDIELQEQAQGDIHASTASGSIRITGLNGALFAHTASGDIEAGGHLAGEADLHTASGSIRLHIGHDAHFNLDADTASGDIRVSQPGAPSSDEHHHLSAAINGGGPTLRAHTASGDIEIN